MRKNSRATPARFQTFLAQLDYLYQRDGFTRNSRSPLEFSNTPSPRLVFELESVSFIEAKSTLAMNATATTLHLFLSLSLSNYLSLSLSVFSRLQRRNFLMARSLAAEPRPRRIVMSLLLLLLLAKRACLWCARRGWRRLPDDRGEVNCVSLLALDLF